MDKNRFRDVVIPKMVIARKVEEDPLEDFFDDLIEIKATEEDAQPAQVIEIGSRDGLKREGIARFGEFIAQAQDDLLPGQDVFITVYRTEQKVKQVANLTNWVLLQVRRYEHGHTKTTLVKLELARRGYEAWKQNPV